MKRFISAIITLSLIMLNLVGCSGETQDMKGEVKKDEKIKVVTTTTIITDLVKTIGGENIEVEGLVGTGIDPHLYKASAGDVNKMQNANIIFYNGLYLEGKMAEIFKNLEKIDIKTVAMSEDIDKSALFQSGEFEGNFDPHIWFDVSLWIKATETVKNSLIELDASNKQEYEKNAKEYIDELKKLDQYIVEKIEKVPKEKRILITAHDAFNYFGRAYNFEVRGLQGISTATEAGTSDVKNLANYIVEKEIPSIFIESSLPRKSVEALQEAVKARGFDVEIGGELFSDSLGEPNAEGGTYIDMIKYNVDIVTKNF